jgi:DMSO reductase anchor subunit
MHPAYSVIFFTTASGAGYGLLAILGLAAATGLIQPDFWFGLVGLGLALGLVSAGLLSSTGHLGRPERAWRGFSQWRSSWLSREAVVSVATYVPAALLAIGWVALGRTDGWVAAAGALAAAGATATVCTTAMIYASLKPIAEWHTPFTLPSYLILATMTGMSLFNVLVQAFATGSRHFAWFALALTALGWVWKEATWRHNDAMATPATANSATGLSSGSVHSIEWPHTEANYLLKEMGYRIARKHAVRLRGFVRLGAFALPIILLAGTPSLRPAIAGLLASIAAVLQLAGMLVERWLFFAEARHTVMLYYGR